uniref:Uncharacterized protein n=1 Tax=Cacopsylla melanoneura TaxID=428564 RepID=A0A8D9A788_9HEMI
MCNVYRVHLHQFSLHPQVHKFGSRECKNILQVILEHRGNFYSHKTCVKSCHILAHMLVGNVRCKQNKEKTLTTLVFYNYVNQSMNCFCAITVFPDPITLTIP